ncbi:unnamed protein product [Schistosoma mattheei]|uniref:Uncharacterized protein n=1 Tax=Schistosoma mattheei TaxID=31246 RepID=A0A183PK83_9TREM|nr:unnamed protein product [Schistosoma mattheei]
MSRYNLVVLRIIETSWTQAGQKRINLGEMLLNSCHEEQSAPHTEGVALMLSEGALNAIIGWESHGAEIIKAPVKTKKKVITMNVIQCYAPTDDSNDVNKHQFYERLQSIIAKCPRKNLTILMGDLNANVRMDNTGFEDIMGQNGPNGRKERQWLQICKFMCIQ